MEAVAEPFAAAAADFWTVAGTTAGIIAAVATVAALVHQVRRSPAAPEGARSGAGATAPVLELALSWMFPTYGEVLGPEGIGLTLTNRQEYPVRWTSASINLQDGSGRHVALINEAPPRDQNAESAAGPYIRTAATSTPAQNTRENT
jgi:hypothetical protein